MRLLASGQACYIYPFYEVRIHLICFFKDSLSFKIIFSINFILMAELSYMLLNNTASNYRSRVLIAVKIR